uniref:Uncharacterized protein n=1 Tax=Medicago truncatula TaxID=3880 RepID=A2Q3W0_MEDTR|nr:hypothetical protein MtrDRAFT_AC155890g11v2 [Medicago truncatula]
MVNYGDIISLPPSTNLSLHNEEDDDDNSGFSFSSVVNCRGFPRKLNAIDFIFPRQLTTEGVF